MLTIEGIIEEIIYSNEINGYTVCELTSDENEVVAVGYMPFINVGETLRLTGKWVTHQEYGEQFKVEAYEKLLPKTLDAIEKYLSSGIIKGVGPVTASRILDVFGEETMEIIQYHPARLTEIKGISLDKAMKIGQAFDQQRELRNVVMFFQQYGVSPNFSAKIYKAFGETTIEEIKANPYKLADEIFGIGFKKADHIARSLGIDPFSKFRICSGIKYVLSQAAASGHTYLPEDKMKEYTSDLLEVKIDSINDAIISLVFDQSICVEKKEGASRVYLSPFYYAELGVCRKIIELTMTKLEVDLRHFDKMMAKIQEQEGIQLADKQITAVREALNNALLVITGGPGTGKTTIIKSIIRFLQEEGHEIALAAPTGRAAKRMSEATGFEAKTIHRLLEIGYAEKDTELNFTKNENNPIEAEVIIIDEMSMVDVLLMNHLLKAIAPGTRLILVGDTDQLPSVGAGIVLKDIIDSSLVKTVKLTEIFRQAEESMIIVNAHRINRGELPFLNKKDRDFFFISKRSGEEILATLIELCHTRLPKTYGFEPLKHIQILTPTRKGVVGVNNINIELQKILNPHKKNKNEKPFGNYIFREGDRVMQVKNNYNLRWSKPREAESEGVGVFNGDTGIIQKVENEEQRITVVFEDEKVVEYDFSILDEIEPAYAVTIHKSQGSEFPVVIIPVYPGPQILMTRNLLYTGVTRAKSLVILVGVENTLMEMIQNQREALRYSGLSHKIKEFFQPF